MLEDLTQRDLLQPVLDMQLSRDRNRLIPIMGGVGALIGCVLYLNSTNWITPYSSGSYAYFSTASDTDIWSYGLIGILAGLALSGITSRWLAGKRLLPAVMVVALCTFLAAVLALIFSPYSLLSSYNSNASLTLTNLFAVAGFIVAAHLLSAYIVGRLMPIREELSGKTCLSCGYCIAAGSLSSVCPECGAAVGDPALILWDLRKCLGPPASPVPAATPTAFSTPSDSPNHQSVAAYPSASSDHTIPTPEITSKSSSPSHPATGIQDDRTAR